MKIGVFDSGIGGLIIAASLIRELPQYDYYYLGDTARVPYGNRSQEAVYRFTEEAVAHLFKANCSLVLLACNTASAEALKRLQTQWLPKYFPDRRILGVIIPTVEEAVNLDKQKYGLLATNSTVESGAYMREFQKLKAAAEIIQQSAPLLVPVIESQDEQWYDSLLQEYLQPLKQTGIEALILGCTHYALLKNRVRKFVGSEIPVLSQDDIIPYKLRFYLERHPEIEVALSKNKDYYFGVTDITPGISQLAVQLLDTRVKLNLIRL